MLPPVVLADYAGTVESSDHSEIRARTTRQSATTTTATTTQALAPQAASDTTVFGVDLSTQPRVRALLHDRRWEYTLTYSPLLTIEDVQQGLAGWLLVHIGGGSIAWHDRAVRVDLSEDASYGTTNSATLAQPASPSGQQGNQQASGPPPASGVTAPVALQPVAAPRTITTLSSSTSARVAVRIDSRASFSASVAYLFGGGADTFSQQTVPQQRGPRADASFTYRAARRTEFVTAAFAQQIEFTTEACVLPSGDIDPTRLCAPQAQIVQGTEGIRHSISRETAFSANLGASLSRSRDRAGVPFAVKPFPVASASVTSAYGERGKGSVQLGVELAPVVDFRTGFVSNRVQGVASLLVPLRRTLMLHLTGTGAQTVPTDEAFALTLVGGDADVELQVSRKVTLSLGERVLWQNQPPFGAFFSGFSYFAVTAAAPALRF